MKKDYFLKKAITNKFAIPQYNFNNAENIMWILEQCEQDKSPVFLGASENAIKYMGGYELIREFVNKIIKVKKITIPVYLHLDHGKSFESALTAINAGFDSVMIDLSKEDFNVNIEKTKDIVKKGKKIIIEGEIGAIGNNVSNQYTDLNEAILYAEKTKVDILAAAVGNAHGLYVGEPQIDFELLKSVYENTKTPLVLHGGTGISEIDLKKCIDCGVVKINFNTELQVAWSNAVRKYLNENDAIYDPRKIIPAGEKAFKEVIAKNNKILNSFNQVV